jgi:CRP-like cAMP-binding protein
MRMWLSEILAPAILLRHIACFLLVAAVAMPGLFLLRVIALASGLVAILLFGFVAWDPAGLFWSVLLVAVLVVRLVLQWQRGPGKPFLPEERLFHEKVVPSLSPAQARKLLSAGQWRDVAAGTVLVRQGEITPELCFLARGSVDVLVDGERIAELHPGSLIGELGIATGDPAAATALCASPVRYLGFESARLYSHLDRYGDLQDAIELAVQRSLREKIHRQNFLAARAAGTARP